MLIKAGYPNLKNIPYKTSVTSIFFLTFLVELTYHLTVVNVSKNIHIESFSPEHLKQR